MAAVPFWAWLIDTRGARLSCVSGCVLLSICGLLRCIPVPKTWHGGVVLVSMLFNGISAPPLALAPPILSASWFDTTERTTATAVMTTFNYLGQALGFILGPAMVPESVDAAGKVIISAADSHANIMALYWLEAGLQLGITLAVILYFPSKPPTPPTPSATDTKTEFFVGFAELLRHRRFLVLVFSFGLPIGTANCNINAMFSIEQHTFQGQCLHSFCSFNRKFRSTQYPPQYDSKGRLCIQLIVVLWSGCRYLRWLGRSVGP